MTEDRIVDVASTSTGNSSSPSLGRRLLENEFSWIWYATALLFLASVWLAPGTIRGGAVAAMLPFAGILAITAVGQTIVIQQRGIDMSLPGMMSFGGIFFTIMGFSTGSMLFACVLTVMVAVVIGSITGFLVARIGITPIVATLSVNAILLGVVRVLSRSAPMAVPPGLADFSRDLILGVPTTLILAIIFIALVSIVTQSTLHGRRFVAVGANAATARAARIPLLPYQVSTYAIATVCFAVAGMLYAGFIGQASHTAGSDYLLPAIASVVVGGTRFSGGRGSVVASGVAALFMVQLGQVVLSMGANSAQQLLVQAAAIVIAVAIRNLFMSVAPFARKP